jgi:hypothetical protein
MARARSAGNGTAGAAGGSKLTKMEAVRRAVAQLGKDAKGAEVHAWVKDHLGVEMTIAHVHNCMSEIRKRARKKRAARQAARKAAAAAVASTPAAQPRPASPPRPAAGGSGGISLEDIEAAKGLLERVGADRLRALIDLLAR